MISKEETRRYVEHYHRYGNGQDAAKYAREGQSDSEANFMSNSLQKMPHVQRMLLEMKEETKSFAPLGDYVDKLEEIRDSALAAGKFSPAIQAHIVIGKLAGHFDKPEQLANGSEAAQLTNDELIQRIAKLTNAKPNLIEHRE